MRIRGASVPMLSPESGPVHALILGEAPGPRGADKSGFPFFGDSAGKHLYRVLESVGAVQLPDAVWTLGWNGAEFAARSIRPAVSGVALDNAFDRCPTDDGIHFRAPARSELESSDNVSRIVRNITALHSRGLRRIIVLGRVAARTARFCLAELPSIGTDVSVIQLPHPSAQGLLSMAPMRGKGARMSDLRTQWMDMCVDALLAAGFAASGVTADNGANT